MNVKEKIARQYHAAFEMLERAVIACPETAWDSPAHANRFWRVAYHALFYTHLYLQESEEHFTPWSGHRGEAHFLGRRPWPPHDPPELGAPYTRAEVLDYLGCVRRQVATWLEPLDLEGSSGFQWLPLTKFELQLYNIRHVQHHAGQLTDRLRNAAGIGIEWVGAHPGPAPEDSIC